MEIYNVNLPVLLVLTNNNSEVVDAFYSFQYMFSHGSNDSSVKYRSFTFMHVTLELDYVYVVY